MEKSKQYKNGFDAAINGVNTTNSHYNNFSTPEKTKQWEIGNKEGKKQIKFITQ